MSNLIELHERLEAAYEASMFNLVVLLKRTQLERELQDEVHRMVWPLLGEEQAGRLIVTTHNENTDTVRVTVEVKAEVAEALVGANDIDGRLASCGFERVLVGEALDGLRYIHFITAA